MCAAYPGRCAVVGVFADRYLVIFILTVSDCNFDRTCACVLDVLAVCVLHPFFTTTLRFMAEDSAACLYVRSRLLGMFVRALHWQCGVCYSFVHVFTCAYDCKL